MELIETALPDVFEVRTAKFVDQRGWFTETWNRQAWKSQGLELEWVQDNESMSLSSGTIRGIHFQSEPKPQDKLVKATVGRILDVAVDLRVSSSTFGQHVAVELSEEVGNQLLIPKGFGHGFVTLESDCRVSYKVSEFYDAERDCAISWCDSDLAIDWGISKGEAVVSDRDAAAPALRRSRHLLFA